MFHPLNTMIHFGEAQPIATSKASTSQLVYTDAPGMSTFKPKVDEIKLGQQKSSEPLTKTAPQPLKPESKAHADSTAQSTSKAPASELKAAQPTNPQHAAKASPPQPKPLSKDEVISKLISLVGQLQAQMDDQQAQLNEFFDSQSMEMAHPQVQEPLAHPAPMANNPFVKPAQEVAEKTVPFAKKTLAQKSLHVLSVIFPTKYMKNLPMNFLESTVQNAGATLGSRVADTCHEKYIHPLFFKKPPPPKKSPVKDAFKDAARLIPEFGARSVLDHLTSNFVHTMFK